MLNIPIGKLLKSSANLAAFSQAIQLNPPTTDGGMALDERSFQDFLVSATNFLDSCRDIGFNVTKSAAVMLVDEMNRIKPVNGQYHFGAGVHVRVAGALRGIQSCLQHESALKVALILPPDKEELFEPSTPAFGKDVQNKFPGATFDIDEAGKCLALGRATASVFHLMRVMEIALRAVNMCLGAPGILIGNDRNWGNILKTIREARQANGVGWPEKDLFSDIYALSFPLFSVFQGAGFMLPNSAHAEC